jgi:branched-chain amino acid transport system permease protein
VVGFLSPDSFDVFLSVDFVAMIIVGGLGSILGSVMGAAVITTLNDSLAGFQSYRPLIFGAILVASMLFMPRGIASALHQARPRRSARRRPSRGWGPAGRGAATD